MMTSRATQLIVLAAAFATQSACFSTHRVYRDPLAPGSELYVEFTSPRTVLISQSGTDTVTLNDVVRLHGQTFAVVGDTIVLRAAKAKNVAGEELLAPAVGTTSFLRDRTTRITERRFDVRRSLYVAGGVTVVLAVAYAALLAAALAGWGQ